VALEPDSDQSGQIGREYFQEDQQKFWS